MVKFESVAALRLLVYASFYVLAVSRADCRSDRFNQWRRRNSVDDICCSHMNEVEPLRRQRSQLLNIIPFLVILLNHTRSFRHHSLFHFFWHVCIIKRSRVTCHTHAQPSMGGRGVVFSFFFLNGIYLHVELLLFHSVMYGRFVTLLLGKLLSDRICNLHRVLRM